MKNVMGGVEEPATCVQADSEKKSTTTKSCTCSTVYDKCFCTTVS